MHFFSFVPLELPAGFSTTPGVVLDALAFQSFAAMSPHCLFLVDRTWCDNALLFTNAWFNTDLQACHAKHSIFPGDVLVVMEIMLLDPRHASLPPESLEVWHYALTPRQYVLQHTPPPGLPYIPSFRQQRLQALYFYVYFILGLIASVSFFVV